MLSPPFVLVKPDDWMRKRILPIFMVLYSISDFLGIFGIDGENEAIYWGGFYGGVKDERVRMV
jgi:hypothetical protein